MKGSIGKASLILLGLLIVQIILLLVIPSSKAGSPTTSHEDAAIAGMKPFSPIELKDVRTIAIQGNEGKSLRLQSEVKKDGDKDTVKWSLPDRDGYPARADSAERIVEALKKITWSRVITRQPKRYAGLNVADGVSQAHVTVTGDGGKALADLYLGDSRDFGSLYARVAGDPAVYLATGAATYDFPTSVSGQVDSAFLDAPADQVTRVKITHGADVLEVVKETPASQPTSKPATETSSQPAESKPVAPRWMTVGPTPETLDTSKVEAWIKSLSKLSLSEPIGKAKKPEHGFDTPTATATLTTADGKEIVVTIGAERKDDRDYFATATGKDWVVTVASYNVTDYFQKKLADLKATSTDSTPPTPDDHEGHDHK